MIRPGFLSVTERQSLIKLARDGLEEHRIARRANAIVLLDDGWSCEDVSAAFLVDDDTIRDWFKSFETSGREGLSTFGYEGSACRLSTEQQVEFKAWLTDSLPRTTNIIGAWLEERYGLSYSRSGLGVLMHRFGFEYRKPEVISRKLDETKQGDFIKDYEDVLNNLDAKDVVLFADAVHPTHQVRPAGVWVPKNTPVAVEQTSGRQRVNIHGAINLETGQTQMIEAPTVNALSTISLLQMILSVYSAARLIHIYLDNARYHHAVLVQEWLKHSGQNIILHFIPPYCPHLNPIERTWGVMHENTTHNKSYETASDFKTAITTFLTETVPKGWDQFRDRITDNFRVISPKDFRVLA